MKVVLDKNWHRLNDVGFLAFTGGVYASLSNNPAFAGEWSDVFTNLAKYKQGIDEFSQLRNEAANKDLVKVAQKNKSREALEAMTLSIALYVEIVADGDPLKLMNTGFTMHTTGSKTSTKKPASAEVTNLRAKHGPLPGQVYVSWTRVQSRGGVYELQMNYGDIADEGSWQPGGTHLTGGKNLITNLKSVSRVAFRVRFIDTAVGPWTTPVTIVVL